MARRLVSYLIVLGVLVHAAALVRHNAVMLEAHAKRALLVADLTVICHPSDATIDPANLPDIPRPTDAQNNCPVCSGLVMATTLPPPAPVLRRVVFDPPRLSPVIVADIWRSPQEILPPTRGPPSLA